MKKQQFQFAIFFSVLMMLLNSSSYAQGGIFNQQATKRKVLLQQIAGIEAGLMTVKKGYNIADNGLKTMHKLKNGTFSLHQDYFASLKQVNPAISHDPRVAEIIQRQQEIISGFDRELSWQKDQAVLDHEEMAYLLEVANNLGTRCTNDLDELSFAITPGKSQMTDRERFAAIAKVYQATLVKSSFSQSFIANAHDLTLDRRSHKHQISTIRKLYDLNN